MIRPNTLKEWRWPAKARDWRRMPGAVAGVWDREPDKRQWIDDATGLPCLMHRGCLGNWCGYVGVPRSHRFYGKRFATIGRHVRGHGGINAAHGCDASGDPSFGVCHVPEAGEHDDRWWIGFDCAHAFDALPAWPRDRYPSFGGRREVQYRDVAYVENAVAALAAELALSAAELRKANEGRRDAVLDAMIAAGVEPSIVKAIKKRSM